jgi:hypothetical protein
MHDAAGFGSAHGRFHVGHTVSPGNSQSECVTGRLVLAVALTTVLPLDYWCETLHRAAPEPAATGEARAELSGAVTREQKPPADLTKP